MIELRRGEHIIVARVVWRDGARAGLHSDERLPTEKIMSLTRPASIRAITSDGVIIERRRHPRPQSIDRRRRHQAFDLAFAFAVMLLFAAEIFDLAQRNFAYRLAQTGAVLFRHL